MLDHCAFDNAGWHVELERSAKLSESERTATNEPSQNPFEDGDPSQFFN